jgi:hypothetical protein
MNVSGSGALFLRKQQKYSLFFNLIEDKQTQLLIKAIEHHNLMKGRIGLIAALDAVRRHHALHPKSSVTESWDGDYYV